MYNDLFSIGPLTVHGYGLMIAIGVLAGLFVAEARAKKRGMNSDILYYMMPFCVILGFLCAKILFCIVEFKSFLENPAGTLTGSGFVVYGGIIGGILAGYIFCKWKKLVFLDYFDIFMPSVALAQGFGRIGCFLAGCCYGRPTESAIGIAFTHSHYAPNGIKLIPTQLISSAGMFVIVGILFYYGRKKRIPGKISALYILLYSIGRFIIEFFRNDYRGEIGILSTSQFISLFMFAAGIVFMIVLSKKEKAVSNETTETDEA